MTSTSSRTGVQYCAWSIAALRGHHDLCNGGAKKKSELLFGLCMNRTGRVSQTLPDGAPTTLRCRSHLCVVHMEGRPICRLHQWSSICGIFSLSFHSAAVNQNNSTLYAFFLICVQPTREGNALTAVPHRRMCSTAFSGRTAVHLAV